MRLLHRNIGYRVIVVPILATITYVLTSETAGGRIDSEVDTE